jgi:hypothetical protein
MVVILASYGGGIIEPLMIIIPILTDAPTEILAKTANTFLKIGFVVE